MTDSKATWRGHQFRVARYMQPGIITFTHT